MSKTKYSFSTDSHPPVLATAETRLWVYIYNRTGEVQWAADLLENEGRPQNKRAYRYRKSLDSRMFWETFYWYFHPIDTFKDYKMEIKAHT